jgi:RimJ/RimL family protein N-acetyltransferase
MLQTDRLDLIPANLEHIEAELHHPSTIGHLLGVNVPEDWPPGEYDRGAMEFFRSKFLADGSAAEGWYTWYGITRNSQGKRELLVAGAGYFGPPSGGVVEIGYSVIPSARNQGYASEMVLALLQHAYQDPSVQEVIAHTTDSNIASTKVLLRCGFHRVGPGIEPGSILFRKRRTGRA